MTFCKLYQICSISQYKLKEVGYYIFDSTRNHAAKWDPLQMVEAQQLFRVGKAVLPSGVPRGGLFFREHRYTRCSLYTHEVSDL